MPELTLQELLSVGQFQPDQLRVTIFTDRDSPMWLATARKAGAHVVATRRIDAEALGPDGLGAIVLVELHETSAPVDTFLPRIDAATSASRSGLIVSCPLESVDQVHARLSHAHAQILVNADDVDRVVALETARVDLDRPMVHDFSPDDPARLHRLADEVRRIARTLSELAGSEPERQPMTFSDGMIGYRAPPISIAQGGVQAAALSAGDVRSIIRTRRMRDRFLPGDLFADPAWDMLLDLIAARLERGKVAVSSLCIAAAVPPTTALRWIKTMTDAGLLVRVADPFDQRRVFIELSDETATAMISFLTAVRREGGPVV